MFPKQEVRKKLWEKPQTIQDKPLEVFDHCQYGVHHLPEELKNDEQAAVLYSPFREKSLNPRSWTRKLEFWEKFLFKTASERNIISFSANDLPSLFQRRGIAPKGLATVIEELSKSGKLKKLESYSKNENWLSWGFNSLVRRPLSWGVTHLLGSPSKSTDSDVYVWPNIVEKVADEVITEHHKNVKHEMSDGVMSLDTFRLQCTMQVSSDQDFDIIFAHLQRCEKVRLKETEDGKLLIKICKSGERTALPFKDTDLQVYRISSTQRKLEKDLDNLSSKVDILYEEARTNVKQGKKTLALHCLRKKNALKKVLDRRTACILKLEDIINKIEEAKTNEMVVKACEVGVAALKTLNSTFSLDQVETVMDQVQETLDDQDEINQSIRLTEPDQDESLEAELENLLSQSVDQPIESPTKDEAQSSPLNESLELTLSKLTVDDVGLPNIPTHSPSGASTSIDERPSRREALPS